MAAEANKTGGVDAKNLASLIGMSEADVRALTRKGVISAQNGLYDTARSLVAISRHLVQTRDTAEAKARAVKAEAELKERRLKAASSSLEVVDAEVVENSASSRSQYSKARADRICRAVANGASLRSAAKAEGLNRATVLLWRERWPSFADQYARACELKWQGYADELDDALEEADRAALDPECGQARIAAIRLRVDTRKWQLGKMLPKIYGDRACVEVQNRDSASLPDGATGGAISADDMARACEAIAARQAALQLKLEAEMAEAAADGDAQRDAIG